MNFTRQRFWIISLALLSIAYPGRGEEITIASWNLENLFDWRGNEQAPDKPTPTEATTRVKLRKRAEIIKQIKPDILGVGEIENRHLLRLLCEEYLQGEGYDYYTLIHEKSPRGINVGVIAKRPFMAQSFSVRGFDRGILACRFVVGGQPVYVLANHWKSRIGGGQDLRMNCANAVIDIADKIIPAYEGRKVPVIVMGDFNDESKNDSVKRLLEAGLVDTFAAVPADKRWTIVYHYRETGIVAYEAFDHLFLRLPSEANWFRWRESRVEYPSQMLTKKIIDGREYVWPDRDVRDHVGYSDHMPVVGKFEVVQTP